MQTQLNIRIDDALKNNAEALFAHLGISLADAIRMFLSQAIIEKGFPFLPRLKEKNKTIVKDIDTVINESITHNLAALKILADR